jgi:hypothetical protein
MKKSIFLLYVTDAWYRNPILLTSCTTKKIALKLAKNDAINENKPLSELEYEFLVKSNQTQGREENYIIQEIKLNTLL